MTASGPAWQPAGQQTPATDTPPHADPVPAAVDAAAETATQADAEPAAPDDARQLKEEIERTREQLGETVERLAAKADMQSRARDKAAELTGRMKTTTARARQQAAARTASLRSQFAGMTATARQKATSAGAAGTNELQRRAIPVRQATPEPVRQAVAKGASTAGQHPVPLAMAAALVAGFLAIWQWRKR